MSCVERFDQLRYPVRNGGDDPRSDATKVAVSHAIHDNVRVVFLQLVRAQRHGLAVGDRLPGKIPRRR